MSIADKLQTITENEQKVFDKGLEQGYNDGYSKGYDEGKNSIDYIAEATKCMNSLSAVFSYSVFPENQRNLVIYKTSNGNRYTLNNAFSYCNAKSVKIIKLYDEKKGYELNATFRNSYYIQIVDFTEFEIDIFTITNAFSACSALREIKGDLDLSQCTATTQAFSNCVCLEDVSFVPRSIKVNIEFNNSALLSDTSIQSIIDGLADLTGSTTQTITFHATVGAKLTDEQKATITAKNWTLAY